MTPRISWHRGGGELAPLASRAAFGEAARHGAELVEVDVRRTADGALVCVHDPSVPGLGEVASLEYGRLDGGDRERVLSWGGFLDALDEGERAGSQPHCSTAVHVDLKGTGYEAEAVSALVERGRPFLVTSGEDSSIAAVRRLAPDAPALLTLGSSGHGLTPRELARLWGSEFVPLARLRRCDATGIAAHSAVATAPLRRWCRGHDMAILVWTIDSTQGLVRWLGRDVDVVTTNRPLAALRLRDGDVAGNGAR